MGPSGSGKSTLLNIVGCLDRPTSGTYTLDGQQVNKLGDGRLAELRNRSIGFVFQIFHLIKSMDARANVELPLIYRGVTGSERKRRATEALEWVGLGDRLHHRPSQLSGGEQQRVAIARALVGRPAVILADEPTGALDSKSSESIMAIFQELNASRGLTIIQVTHDEIMARHASRLVRLLDGVIESQQAVDNRLVANTGGVLSR